MKGVPWTKAEIAKAKKTLASSLSVSDAARKLGMHPQGLRAALAGVGVNALSLVPAPVEDVSRLRIETRARATEKNVRTLQRKLVATEEAQDFWTTLHRMPSISVTSNRSRPKSGKRPGTPVTMCSDLHCGEVVTEAETLGRNTYDVAEFRRRMGNFTDNVMYLRKRTKQDATADDHVLSLNGDMISGSIHPELTETNEVEPAEQVYICAEATLPLIEALAADCRRVIVPCIGGNHGRNSLKSQMKNGWAHSLETHLYRYLRQATRHLENVEWLIPQADHLQIDVMGTRVQCQHGTFVKSQGGVGGILVPLSKHAMRCDLPSGSVTLYGHFHQVSWFSAGSVTIIVNGSLIGDSAYSRLLGLSYRPPEQIGFLLDERRGVRSIEPISVT